MLFGTGWLICRELPPCESFHFEPAYVPLGTGELGYSAHVEFEFAPGRIRRYSSGRG